MLAGTSLEYTGPWDVSKITNHAIQRRITASSKGLIETRTGNYASVQFIHLSVNDFLLRNQRLQTLDQSLQPDPISASHGQLWHRCWSEIKRLISTTSSSERDLCHLSVYHPFLQYSANYVFDHAEKALSGGAMRQEIARWLQIRDDWFEWWKAIVLTLDGRGVNAYLHTDIGVGLLYVLSLRGYPNLVALVLAEGGGADVNAQGGSRGNALQAACFRKNANIVRQLLQHGADANAQGGHHGNALQAACFGEDVGIVQLLLEHGADVNAPGGLYVNALQAASTEGDAEIVQQLLDHGANVNAQGGDDSNILQTAASRRDAKMMRLLLEHGADINAQGGHYGNALQAASFEGDAEIVQQLLEHGADVNAQGGHFGNALQAAAVGGDAKTMRLLLEHGADINALGGHYSNALQAVSIKEYDEVVRLLLKQGAEYVS